MATKAPASAKPSKKAQASNPPKTLVVFLLDRSGSMEGIRDSAIQSFNGMVKEMQASTADIRLSLVQFDTAPAGGMDLHTVYSGKRVAQVEPLTKEGYEPRGMTPLCDAIATTIEAVEESLRGRTPKVVIAVQTDGRENASRRFGWEKVRALIAAKSAQGWEFQFLGAGLEANAYEQSHQMGIHVGSTVSYNKDDAQASLRAFEATGSNIRAFAEGTAASTAYSDVQKMAAGDASVGADVLGRFRAAPDALRDTPNVMGGQAMPGGQPLGGGFVSGMVAPRSWVGSVGPVRPMVAPVEGATVGPVAPLNPRTPAAVVGPVAPLVPQGPMMGAGVVTRGVGFDPLRGVMGTADEVLSPPTSALPFALDAFGEGKEDGR